MHLGLLSKMRQTIICNYNCSMNYVRSCLVLSFHRSVSTPFLRIGISFMHECFFTCLNCQSNIYFSRAQACLRLAYEPVQGKNAVVVLILTKRTNQTKQLRIYVCRHPSEIIYIGQITDKRIDDAISTIEFTRENVMHIQGETESFASSIAQ